MGYAHTRHTHTDFVGLLILGVTFSGEASMGGKVWAPNPNVKKHDPAKDDPLTVQNQWYTAKAQQWELRTADYLDNDLKPKLPSKDAAFELVGLSMITSLTPVKHLADHIKSLRK